MYEIEWIQERVRKDEYYFSKHGDQERQNDNLTVTEIELVAGFTDTGKPIHIICGERGNWVVVITVYIPRPPKFKTPYERGEK